MTKRSSLAALDAFAALLFAACAGTASGKADSTRAVRLGDTITQVDTSAASQPPVARDTSHTAPLSQVPPKRLPPLSPAAQRVADALVFAPRTQTWFVVAVRAKRLLADLGRADISFAKDTTLKVAFGEAARRYSPLPIGSVLRVHGAWGFVEDAKVADFDVWNGRIVARLQTSALLDSLVRHSYVQPGVGLHVDSVTLAAEDSVRKLAVADSITRDSIAKATRDSIEKLASRDPKNRKRVVKRDTARADTAVTRVDTAMSNRCTHDSVPAVLAARVLTVRDSIEHWLADSAKAPYPRLERTSKVYTWVVPGCYGIGHVLVLAGRRNPTMEFSAEKALMVGDTGNVLRLRLSDLRFHFHEPLAVFDADGDGIDDVATRSLGDRSGGLSIMRLDTATKRLQRLASGFAWETP